MRIEPIADRLLVERISAEDKSAGGILIPDMAKEKPLQGIVLAVGPGRRDAAGALLPMQVALGDRVLFGKYAGQEIMVDGKDCLILREDEVQAIQRA
jgi:chaperonin GroES